MIYFASVSTGGSAEFARILAAAYSGYIMPENFSLLRSAHTLRQRNCCLFSNAIALNINVGIPRSIALKNIPDSRLKIKNPHSQVYKGPTDRCFFFCSRYVKSSSVVFSRVTINSIPESIGECSPPYLRIKTLRKSRRAQRRDMERKGVGIYPKSRSRRAASLQRRRGQSP